MDNVGNIIYRHLRISTGEEFLRNRGELKFENVLFFGF